MPAAPLAFGANCGVGAPDILVSLLQMTADGADVTTICKGNCGVPRFQGTDIVYTGTPELMARYAELAIDAGARIIGGCCGTSPEHLAAMRLAIDGHERGARPDLDRIRTDVGPLANRRLRPRPQAGTASPQIATEAAAAVGPKAAQI